MSAGRSGGAAATSRAVGTRSAERVTAQERFDRRVRARRGRIRTIIVVLVLLTVALGGLWWALWRSDWLVVKQVAVSGVEPRWEQAILGAAAIDKPQPMVEVDTDAATVAVAEVGIVRAVEVHRSWPSTITIAVTAREPVLAVREAGGFALVDADGVVIEAVGQAPDGVPVLHTRGRDGASPDAYRAAWAVLSALPDSLAAQVTTATISSADLLTLELGERTIVWGGADDSALKVRVVEALLGAGERYIDVSAPRTPVTRPA